MRIFNFRIKQNFALYRAKNFRLFLNLNKRILGRSREKLFDGKKVLFGDTYIMRKVWVNSKDGEIYHGNSF